MGYIWLLKKSYFICAAFLICFGLNCPVMAKPMSHTLTPNPDMIQLTAPVGQIASATITLTASNIDNDDPVEITFLDITVGNPPFAISSQPGSTSLGEGQSTTFGMVFKPSSPGNFSGTITINTRNAGVVRVSLNGTATSTTPVLQVDPASVDFGDVAIGQTVSRKVTVRNSGAGVLMLNQVLLSGGMNFGFSVSPPPLTSIPQGQSTTFDVNFSPTTAGIASGTVTVMSNSGSSTVMLRGNATAGPLLRVQPPSINFGDVTFGEMASQKATILNDGGSPLNISAVAIMAGGDAGFSVSQPALTMINPGQNTSFDILFKPVTAGTATGTIRITSNGGSTIVMLVGNSKDAIAPTVSLTAPNGGETLMAGIPFNIQFSGKDNDALSGFTVAYSADGTTFLPENEIARVGPTTTSVIWNIPAALQTTQGRIRVTAQDRSGNTSSAMSNTFTVQRQASTSPVLSVTITFDPPPPNQIAPPQNVRVDVSELPRNPNLTSDQQTSSPIVGFNIFRVAAPAEGQPAPTAEQIVGDPRNLVGSVSANRTFFVDTVSTIIADNFIYSLTTFFGNGMQSSGSQPAGTSLPVIKNPVFDKKIGFLIDATGSFVKDGAMLIVSDRENFPLQRDSSGMRFVVPKNVKSTPGNQKFKKLTKPGTATRLVVKNPDGKSSIGVMFTR
jgi:hypothetical protein